MKQTEKDKLRQDLMDAKPEDRMRFRNSANDQLINIISNEFGTLPVISAIAAALLVIATFGSQLLPLTTFVKVLISILIFLVPSSLICYLIFMKIAQQKGEDILEICDGHKWGMGWWNYIPFIFAAVISTIVIIILYLIW